MLKSLCIVLFFCCTLVELNSQELSLSVRRPDSQGWVELSGQADSENHVVTLQASSNLVDWKTLAVLHGPGFLFKDPASPKSETRYYKFFAHPLTFTNDWKNQVSHPYDPFRGTFGGYDSWIKFVILADDPARVYYSDSRKFTFHYDFVTQRIEPYIGISAEEFNNLSLYSTNRAIILGVLFFPGNQRREYGIQFISSDPFPKETIRELYEVVRSTVTEDATEPGGRQAYYIPTFNQSAQAQLDAAYFESNAIPVASADKWAGGNICYSRGWALGSLKFIHATNVPAAYTIGDLGPMDILLTDGIPAELPFVSGILSLTATTPNSHVAILAQSYNVPFAYILDPAEQNRILQLTNKEVAFQTGMINDKGSCSVLLLPVEPQLDTAARQELFALKNNSHIEIVPKQTYGHYTASTEDLVPADIKYFGGKAANYGVLRRAISTNVYPAIAISFDLWDEFMQQNLVNGKTLWQEITNRLNGFTYPPNVANLRTELDAIRTIIRSAQFTPAQVLAVTDALAVFDSNKNIRFRSSTNVEDAESFSGAGLYDSYSGCLADDLDANTSGPSICDPTEDDERGVFRAIRRVYASFFNDNAFLERLRLGINPESVGMAILVHHSTPDEIEMANGVATGWWRRDNGEFYGEMVTQLGAVSVANPDGSAIPEEVHFSTRPAYGVSVNLLKNSSLRRLGETVMDWDEDYLLLGNLLSQSASAFAAFITNKPSIKLDIEYKKVSPGTIELKQIREVPTFTNRYVAPFVLNRSDSTLSVWQGFYGNLFLSHKLKSRWRLEHRNSLFTSNNLSSGFYTHLTIEYLDGTNIYIISSPFEELPNYHHEVISYETIQNAISVDSWTINTSNGPLSFALRTYFSDAVDSLAPFRTVPEGMFSGTTLDVQFSQPQLSINTFGAITYETNLLTSLYELREENINDIKKELFFNIPGQGTNIFINSSVWFPKEARGWDCRCPLLRIPESTIVGFTTEPLVLRGFWSQTFSDIHTAGFEQFLFEPRLEEGLSDAQRNELTAADIAKIYVNHSAGSPVLLIIGLDGSTRQFSDSSFDN